MQQSEIQLVINKITEAQASTMTMNEGELYLAPDNAVYSVNNVTPVDGNVTLDIANKDLSNLSTTGNAKFQAPITGGASTITSSNLTANRALISGSSGKVAVSAVTSAQLGYLSTVTSNVQTQLNGKQAKLVSGTNIKTINSTSILGGGNIDTSEMFIATYGVTTFRDVLDAFQDDKEILVKDVDIQNTTGNIFYAKLCVMQILDTPVAFWFSYIEGNSIKRYLLEADNSWSVVNLTAETTNNKVTSISSSSTNAQYPSAKCVYDDLQNRADVDLSNLNSTGQAVIDGQWVGVNHTILANPTTAPTSDLPEIDLSSYLPNDNYAYEVLLMGAVGTGTTSGNQTRIILQSSIITDSYYMVSAQTRSTSSVTAYGCCVLPIGSDKELKVMGYTNNTGAISLYLRGYRRIGTNS